jgi:hypothetical protein
MGPQPAAPLSPAASSQPHPQPPTLSPRPSAPDPGPAPPAPPPRPPRLPARPAACARNGLGVRPRRGDALLFFSLKPDGATQDPASLHAGCPVVRGTKWIATKVGGERPRDRRLRVQGGGARPA